MKLYLLVPEGKPPFIAIAFTEAHEAENINSDVFTSPLVKRPCKIVLEMYLKGAINLSLICEDMVTVRFYPHVQCSMEQLRSWLFITRNAKLFKFAHILERSTKIEIPVANKSTKRMAINVSSVEILNTNLKSPIEELFANL